VVPISSVLVAVVTRFRSREGEERLFRLLRLHPHHKHLLFKLTYEEYKRNPTTETLNIRGSKWVCDTSSRNNALVSPAMRRQIRKPTRDRLSIIASKPIRGLFKKNENQRQDGFLSLFQHIQSPKEWSPHNPTNYESLIPVHPLRRAPAHLPIGRRGNRSTTSCTGSTGLLEGKQLLGTESLVVDLRGGLDEVLKVCAGEEVSQVDELAVVLVLNVDHAPSILTSSNLLAVHDDRLLRTDHREGDDILNLSIERTFLLIQLVIVVRVHLQIVESEFFLDPLLESGALLQSKRVGLRDDRDNIDNIGELLQDDNIDRLKGVPRRLDEEQAAVDTSVLNITFSLGGEFFAEIRRVLIFDVLHDRIPASLVVDLVSIAGGVDDVETEPDTVLLNDMRNSLDLGGRAYGFIWRQAAFRIDEMGCENGVDERRLSESGLANTYHVELESTLQELPLDLRSNAVETDMTPGKHGGLCLGHYEVARWCNERRSSIKLRCQIPRWWW